MRIEYLPENILHPRALHVFPGGPGQRWVVKVTASSSMQTERRSTNELLDEKFHETKIAHNDLDSKGRVKLARSWHYGRILGGLGCTADAVFTHDHTPNQSFTPIEFAPLTEEMLYDKLSLISEKQYLCVRQSNGGIMEECVHTIPDKCVARQANDGSWKNLLFGDNVSQRQKYGCGIMNNLLVNYKHRGARMSTPVLCNMLTLELHVIHKSIESLQKKAKNAANGGMSGGGNNGDDTVLFLIIA